MVLTHGSAVSIWKAFVYPLSHEDPAVVFKLAFYNLIVILFQVFCYLFLKQILYEKQQKVKHFLCLVSPSYQ